MTVTVARKLIQGPKGLTETAALALAFIDGGLQWLSWAIGETASSYAFADETEMLVQVQLGLHQSPMTLLPHVGLPVSPMKLMTMSPADLRVLAKAESGSTDPVVARQLRSALSAHDLDTLEDLRATDSFLAALGVADAPALQNMGLDDRKAIHALMTLPRMTADDGPRQEGTGAAAFAADLARTPMEFADYFRAYLAQTDKLKVAGKPADEQRQVADTAVRTLLPLMFAALDCPQVSGIVAPAVVAGAVTDWLRQGRRIGFSRVSEGVCQIIDSTTFTTETGAAAQQVVNLYLANSMSFLAGNAPLQGRMSQNGASCLFPIRSGSLFAELRLEATGGITLRQFRRLSTTERSA